MQIFCINQSKNGFTIQFYIKRYAQHVIYSNFIFLENCPLDGLRILKCVLVNRISKEYIVYQRRAIRNRSFRNVIFVMKITRILRIPFRFWRKFFYYCFKLARILHTYVEREEKHILFVYFFIVVIVSFLFIWQI